MEHGRGCGHAIEGVPVVRRALSTQTRQLCSGSVLDVVGEAHRCRGNPKGSEHEQGGGGGSQGQAVVHDGQGVPPDDGNGVVYIVSILLGMYYIANLGGTVRSEMVARA